MTWEHYKKRPFLRAGVKSLGTLSVTGRYAQLLVGALLREKGFDVSQSYELFFNRRAFAIGLQISENGHGFKVTRSHNGTGSSQGWSIRMTGFCNRFEITDRCEISKAKFDGEMWVLTLKPEKR